MTSRIPRPALQDATNKVLSNKREREGTKDDRQVPSKRANAGEKQAPTWPEIMEEEGIDVQELLNRKLKSGKFDVKGKNAEMLVLLRQFKACVRHMIEQVEDLEMQIVTTRSDMERLAEAHKNDLERADLEASKLLDKVHSLESQVTDHRGQVKNAEDNIKKLQSELASKEASIREIEFKNKSQEADIKKLSLELQQAKDETDKLQELNKRAQEYASGLQEYNSKLQDDAAAMQQANSKLHKEKADLSQDVASFKGQIEAIQMQLTSAQEGAKAVEESRAALREEVNKLHSRISDLEKEKTSYIEDLEKTKVELKQFRETSGQTAEEVAEAHARAQGLQKEHKQQQEIIAELRRQLDIAKQQKEITEGICSEKAADLEQHLQHVAHLQKSLVDAQRRIEEGEATRKKLHNTILELKGNIRVFCRVRALMEHEQTGVDGEVISFPEETDENRGRTIDLAISKGDEGKPNNLYNFVFDKVFPPDVSQELVFEEISQLVQSALDGYKVSIFAYGQTGSGKTYTMFGPSSLGNEAGMIPRSMLQIFESSGELAQRGWEFKMGASMLEIYNEDVVDLLGKKLPAGKTHQIQHDGKGNTHITDLTVVEVTHPNQVEKLMNRATNCRSVGSTNINERSSRSHCVFRLTIDGSNPATGQQVHGVLNLIDLAGSERLAKSGAVGERLKETQAINKSLSALGDVICALNEQSAHIPYRNSKLTYLLQPCLGGDSKTLMFVNLNPRPDAASESLCSLRFAAKVNACEVGTARRNTGRKK